VGGCPYFFLAEIVKARPKLSVELRQAIVKMVGWEQVKSKKAKDKQKQ